MPMQNKLERLLNQKGVLLADGATGSNLFEVGLQTGDAPELWNDIHPDKIANQYQSFIDAGADIILTNSFGGTRHRLKLHVAAERVQELNFKAARIARQQVQKAERAVLVGGSMGPTGEIMAPLGCLSQQEAAAAFAQQASALAEGGVDIFWIETMSSKEEVEAAVIGASRVGLPVVATFSVDTNGRTMMGLSPSDIVKLAHAMENVPYAIGANCGVGASESVAVVVNMKHACAQQNVSPVIIVKANCGVPEYIDGKIVYSGSAAIMAEYAKLAVDAGATIIGGCCGTTPQHVAAMRRALDQHTRGDTPQLDKIVSLLGAVSVGARAQLKGDLSIAGGALSGRGQRARRRRRG